MLIPKFRERANYEGRDREGRRIAFNVWGLSNESATDAKTKATQRVKQVFERWVNGRERRNDYDYLDQPLREEIVETIADNGDEKIRMVVSLHDKFTCTNPLAPLA
jgi:hypothetical protein